MTIVTRSFFNCEIHSFFQKFIYSLLGSVLLLLSGCDGSDSGGGSSTAPTTQTSVPTVSCQIGISNGTNSSCLANSTATISASGQGTFTIKAFRGSSGVAYDVITIASIHGHIYFSNNPTQTATLLHLDANGEGTINYTAQSSSANDQITFSSAILGSSYNTTLALMVLPSYAPGAGNQAPSLSYDASTGTTGGQNLMMSVSPSNIYENGAAITACGIKNGTTALPSQLSVDPTTCVISGTPTALLTQTVYTLAVTNSFGTSNATVNLAVAGGVPTLSYSGAAGTQIIAGNALSIIPTTLTNHGSAITSCGIMSGTTALPTTLSVNQTTCEISGLPIAVLANTAFTLTSTNAVGVSSVATVSIRISAGVPTLSYQAVDPAGFTSFNHSMSVAPSSLNTHGAPITGCAASSSTPLPYGLTVNYQTCVIAGKPQLLSQLSNYAIVATNSAGNSVAATVSLVVNSDIATGPDHVCSISGTGTVFCWGSNNHGQLGMNSTVAQSYPVQVVGPNNTGYLTGIIGVTAGNEFSCALKSTGDVYCWGSANSGQVGADCGTNGCDSTGAWLVPVKVAGLSSIYMMSGGNSHTCAIDTNHHVYCWGVNNQGDLGYTATSKVPAAVPSVDTLGINAVALGDQHTCGVTGSGSVYCWGANSFGQLGNNSTTQSNSAVQVLGAIGTNNLPGMITLAAGGSTTCSITSDSNEWVYCWGNNTNGQLGNGTVVQSNLPTKVKSTVGGTDFGAVRSISVGDSSSCATMSTGYGYCWGSNTSGQLGINSTTQSTVPARITVMANAYQQDVGYNISSGTGYACSLEGGIDGPTNFYCWGSNSTGQLGNASLATSLVPVQVPGVGGTGALTP